jgi:hypothetical protein
MKHEAGCKIEYCHHGDWELIYFGDFVSQSLYIRNLIDLKDIYDKIGKEIEVEEKALEGLATQSTDS